jgi:hypothetical protein
MLDQLNLANLDRPLSKENFDYWFTATVGGISDNYINHWRLIGVEEEQPFWSLIFEKFKSEKA